MKEFFAEFREFISKGNVVSMAVGIIVGGAFTAIVNSLVDCVISPLIGLLMGGLDFSSLSFGFRGAQFLYGSFIQSVINFLITAFVLFLIVKGMNKLSDLAKKEEEEQAPAEDPADIKLLTEIRDLLKESK